MLTTLYRRFGFLKLGVPLPIGPLCIVLWEVGVEELVQESADILDTVAAMSNKVL